MFGNGVDGILKPVECFACSKAVKWVDGIFDNKKTVDYIFDTVSALCWISGQFKPRNACKQIVVQFGTPLVEMTKNHLLTKNKICDEMLGFCNRPKITELDLEQVVNDILSTKP